MIEQKQKSFSYFMYRTKHNINFSKANDRNNTNKCNQQIYYTQSQVQHMHAYLHPANTDGSYSIEKEEKLNYL